MKLTLTFKTPDAAQHAIEEAINFNDGFCDDNNYLADKCYNICEQWVEYGEYVTIEIDTEEKTAKVVPVKE